MDKKAAHIILSLIPGIIQEKLLDTGHRGLAERRLHTKVAQNGHFGFHKRGNLLIRPGGVLTGDLQGLADDGFPELARPHCLLGK